MMTNLAESAVLLSRSIELLLIVKATLLLGACLTAVHCSRRARASARHLIVASCFAALAVLPALAVSAPPLTIDVSIAASSTPGARPAATTPRTVTADPVKSKSTVSESSALTFAQVLRLLWLVGAIAFLVQVVSPLWRLSIIRRTALPTEWHHEELARLTGERGLRRPVQVLEHEAAAGPMTFGVLRPVIVLPLDARHWPAADLRRALVHELEHIQRGDWLMQIIARVVAACYWFHPLVWTAWRRLCLEAERSCDDVVLQRDERTDYAEQLVRLAQRMTAAPMHPLLGMASRSDLTTRVTAVLDDRLHRGRAGFALAATTMLAITTAVVMLAPVRAVAISAAVTAVNGEQQGRAPRLAGERKARALDRELYEAAQAGDLNGVKEMLEAGASANAVIEGDGSPLIGAARSGRLEIARLLLEQGADPNQIVVGDGSPLIVAAGRGQLDQVRLLVERGGDVNLAVAGDENPLMNAAGGGHLAVVQYLVDRGVDIHTRLWSERSGGGGEWRTAVSQARRNGHLSIVKYLESLGARN